MIGALIKAGLRWWFLHCLFGINGSCEFPFKEIDNNKQHINIMM